MSCGLTYTFHITSFELQLFFIDNQSHLLIWKHIGSVDKDKGLVIKGFLRVRKVIYCNSSKGYSQNVLFIIATFRLLADPKRGSLNVSAPDKMMSIRLIANHYIRVSISRRMYLIFSRMWNK